MQSRRETIPNANGQSSEPCAAVETDKRSFRSLDIKKQSSLPVTGTELYTFPQKESLLRKRSFS